MTRSDIEFGCVPQALHRSITGSIRTLLADPAGALSG
jgi:hypothetical protein